MVCIWIGVGDTYPVRSIARKMGRLRDNWEKTYILCKGVVVNVVVEDDDDGLVFVVEEDEEVIVCSKKCDKSSLLFCWLLESLRIVSVSLLSSLFGCLDLAFFLIFLLIARVILSSAWV